MELVVGASGTLSDLPSQNLGQVATSPLVPHVASATGGVKMEGGGDTESDTEQMDSESQLIEPFQEILALSTEPMKLSNPVFPASQNEDATKPNQYWFFVV